MRQELENIYENLYDSYPNRRGYYPDDISFYRTIQREIDFRSRQLAENSETQHLVVRPDAKLFLLVVFHEIIVVPILSANRSETPTDFRENIASDISRIINKAIENKSNTPYLERSEITAHSILTAVDQIYDTLTISNVKLWNT